MIEQGNKQELVLCGGGAELIGVVERRVLQVVTPAGSAMPRLLIVMASTLSVPFSTLLTTATLYSYPRPAYFLYKFDNTFVLPPTLVKALNTARERMFVPPAFA